jgi:hypothetical protein
MQQPASRAVKAARKRGVHAEGLRAYRLIHRQPTGVLCHLLLYCGKAREREKLFLEIYKTYQWPTDVLLARPVHDEDIVRLHQFFFHARRREEDVVFMSDRDAAASAGDPAERVELAAQGTNQVGWVLWVVRFDERVCVAVLRGGHGVRASVVSGGQMRAQIELR